MPATEYVMITVSVATAGGGLIGALYAVVRLAIRAEIATLKNEISDRYVSRDTCAACRRDCPTKITLAEHLSHHIPRPD
jgi:L-lactate utilization protein LutB